MTALVKSKHTYVYGDPHKWCYSNCNVSLTTPRIVSKHFAAQVKALIPACNECKLWDMFSGIGMDAISLAKYFNTVLCTEIDYETCNHLANNVSAFNCSNITVAQADCCDMIDFIQCHAVYFDPPWGCSIDSSVTNFDFNIKLGNGNYILDIIDMITERFTHVIVKSPFNSNTVEQHRPDDVKFVIGYPHAKIKFIYLSIGS